jgi:hypothetical protein
MVEEHAQVDFWRAAVLILRRQGVAGEQEHLARMPEEAGAARLTGRLLHRLQAQRATRTEEISGELPRDHQQVAAHLRHAGSEDPRGIRRAAALPLSDSRLRPDVDQLELLQVEMRAEDFNLVGLIQRH